MEIVLEVGEDPQFIFTNDCFNPYFRGDSSGSETGSAAAPLMSGFNPYFRGDSSGSFILHLYVSCATLFQSLFSWR